MAPRHTPAAELRATLRAKVVPVLKTLVPAFAQCSDQHVYDAVMNSPEVMAHCLRLFGHRRDAFELALIDTGGLPAAGNDTRLACGSTVAETVTLMVRAAARRYFRAHLADRPGTVLVVHHPHPWWHFWGGPEPVTRRKVSYADRLYHALKRYLVHDWQASLIPVYAELSVDTVMRAGNKLLALRDPDEVRALSAATAAAPGRAAAAASAKATAAGARTPAGPPAGVKDRALAPILSAATNVVAHFLPKADEKAVQEAISRASEANRTLLSTLMGQARLDTRGCAAFLALAVTRMGPARFQEVFGTPARFERVLPELDHLTTRDPRQGKSIPEFLMRAEACVDAISAPPRAA